MRPTLGPFPALGVGRESARPARQQVPPATLARCFVSPAGALSRCVPAASLVLSLSHGAVSRRARQGRVGGRGTWPRPHALCAQRNQWQEAFSLPRPRLRLPVVETQRGAPRPPLSAASTFGLSDRAACRPALAAGWLWLVHLDHGGREAGRGTRGRVGPPLHQEPRGCPVCRGVGGLCRAPVHQEPRGCPVCRGVGGALLGPRSPSAMCAVPTPHRSARPCVSR